MSDEEFINAFENGTLCGQDFHHADHVRMGFLYLCRFPALEAVRRFSEALQQFAATNGNPGLYHETITWAFLFLIRERIAHLSEQTGHPPNWTEFAAANPDLLDWKNNILRRYYLDETLASNLAKKTFVLPNQRLTRSMETE